MLNISIITPHYIVNMKALEIHNLRKTYKGKTEALKGISFSIEEGDFFALLGPNGAGKSTTINIISHLVNKSEGEVRVFGVDIEKDQDLTKSYLGMMPQEFNFNIFEQVEDILVEQAGYFGIPRKVAIPRAEELLKKLNLWDKRHAKSMTLSGGMKRKLMIARAMMHSPRLLILDEPTAGVDVETRRDMWEFLEDMNKKGTTIILTTHYLEEAEQLCKNIAIINKGEIIENTSIKEFLTKLDKETFVLDLKSPMTTLPELTVPVRKIDETTLEVEIPKSQTINQALRKMDEQGFEILSMRNKSNRLEELFIDVTKE